MGQYDPNILARRILDKMWQGRGIPVDPVTISRRFGLQVKQTSLPPEVSGAIIKKRGEDPVILIEEADSDNRKRFTCAHELGHFIDRSERGEENFEFVDLRDASSSSGTNADEVFANQFAAALLMPEELVRQQWAENKVVPFLAVAFGVSADAMTFRLKNLGLVR